MLFRNGEKLQNSKKIAEKMRKNRASAKKSYLQKLERIRKGKFVSVKDFAQKYLKK